MPRPAVFLDRDGVLNESVPGGWVTCPEDFHWLPGSIDAVRRLNEAGLPVVIITNQSGVGRGIMDMRDVDAVHARMESDFHATGAYVDGIYSCPHAPGFRCECRKPLPGLILEACRALDLDPARSIMVGDSARDLEAGRAAGSMAVAVTSGLASAKDVEAWNPAPFRVFNTLSDVVDWIIAVREPLC